MLRQDSAQLDVDVLPHLAPLLLRRRLSLSEAFSAFEIVRHHLTDIDTGLHILLDLGRLGGETGSGKQHDAERKPGNGSSHIDGHNLLIKSEYNAYTWPSYHFDACASIAGAGLANHRLRETAGHRGRIRLRIIGRIASGVYPSAEQGGSKS